MNNGLKITLLVLIAMSFVLLTGCDKAQVQEPVSAENLNSAENNNLERVMYEYTCRGWAVYKTNLIAQNKQLQYIPDNLFSHTDDMWDACIIEWENDHVGYITTHNAQYIWVSEYVLGEEENNCYYPPDYTHATAGDLEYWWEKDPNVALYVNISGPTELEPSEIDDFTAYQGGGCTEYYDYYKWWKRNDEGMKKRLVGDDNPAAPPPGEWIYLDTWEDEKTISICSTYDFSLKCEVMDRWGAKATDIHSVTID